MEFNPYYSKKIKNPEMYQKLIQYWSIMFDKSLKAKPLDHMNFNMDIFPPPITLTEIEKIVKFEPGYASPDGSVELESLIKDLELARLNYVSPKRNRKNKELVKKAGIGAANGCTNVMNGLLNSIPKLSKTNFPRQSSQPEIVLTLPNYTVYLAQVSNMGKVVKPRFLGALRKNHFLPTFEQVKKICNKKTAAIIITYPNNPAQSTYEGKSIKDLKKIVSFCQKKGIFLIVDNIYQDGIYSSNKKHVEIFSLTNKIDYIIKVFGPSKDTAFYSGYRCGYWFGDPRIQDAYKYYISATENSLNSISMILFAWNILFKSRRLSKKPIKLADMKLLNTGLFGQGKHFNKKSLFKSLKKEKLFEKYNERVNKANIKMEKTNEEVTNFVKKSKYFSDYVNQKIGNVFLIKINPKYFKGDDDEFFHSLVKKTKYAILPGNVFGLPKKKSQVWFRITLIHDSCKNIINGLRRIEKFLESNSN